MKSEGMPFIYYTTESETNKGHSIFNLRKTILYHVSSLRYHEVENNKKKEHKTLDNRFTRMKSFHSNDTKRYSGHDLIDCCEYTVLKEISWG